MIEKEFADVHLKEWVKQNIDNINQELVILHQVIPWKKNNNVFAGVF